MALGLLVMPACSRAVPGTPSAVPGTSSAVPGGIAPSTPRARAPALVSDVLADECLLDSAEFRALLGRAVRAEQSVVRRTDGTQSTSCYATAVDDPGTPMAAINVYRVRSGTPAEFVSTARGRPLPDAGEAAVLLETAAGPTLQVAAPAFLVTLVVQGRSPPDESWRAAARSALARLPS